MRSLKKALASPMSSILAWSIALKFVVAHLKHVSSMYSKQVIHCTRTLENFGIHRRFGKEQHHVAQFPGKLGGCASVCICVRENFAVSTSRTHVLVWYARTRTQTHRSHLAVRWQSNVYGH